MTWVVRLCPIDIDLVIAISEVTIAANGIEPEMSLAGVWPGAEVSGLIA